MQVRFLQHFLKTESAGGLFLLISATLAIILANSPFSIQYSNWVESKVFIVNDVFMAIFFLLVGLELKREWATDHLDLSSIKLPMAAAVGGMLVPALLYLLINLDSETLVGWPIPVATDIAFALGTLALFGKRVPPALKIFLMSLAIFDDIGAKNIAYLYLGLASLTIAILFIFNRLRISLLSPYLVVGGFLWYTCLKSGIHPTIAYWQTTRHLRILVSLCPCRFCILAKTN
jgi:NhaA family Na+:H+ antiporter